MRRLLGIGILIALFSLLAGCEEATSAPEPLSETEKFSVVIADTKVGGMTVEHAADGSTIEYTFSNNGRGPTLNEAIRFGANGMPIDWKIEGNTVFGNSVDEFFDGSGEIARWSDATGPAEKPIQEGAFYVAQNASPYALWLYARFLLDTPDQTAEIFPGGTLQLTQISDLTIQGEEPVELSLFAISGIAYDPSYILLDEEQRLFAFTSPFIVVVREGFEAAFTRLRDLAVSTSAQRYEDIQRQVAQQFDGPVRIDNVRVFQPETQTLSELASVLIEGNEIAAIDGPGTRIGSEHVFDGAGGSLVPGFYEMHGHVTQQNSLLNIAAGVTSVRDMGNSNDVLDDIIAKIASRELAGPRITRSGFIEGASPFSANNGTVVASEEEAVTAVRDYAERGDFYQIKLYSSINPDWVPAMVAEARRHNLAVTGHVPAFTTADAMIAAGYDELTHMNQLMLGWVLDEAEDTRTLLRLTAMKRVAELDFDSPQVQSTLDAMVENSVGMDPTLAIFEMLFLSRNGSVTPGAVDYVDHLPVGLQRQARTAWVAIPDEAEDQAYRVAYDKTVETLRRIHERGLDILPGTDLGGSFPYHRELELYQEIGLTPGEILKLGSYDMAQYLGQGDLLGSIEVGKLADFSLVPGDPTQDIRTIKSMSMVVADGIVYFPSDIYEAFGIRPFAEPPDVVD